MTPVPTGIEGLTPAWLTGVLGGRFGGEVVAVDAGAIGTGQVADSYRLGLTWSSAGAGPATLVAKVTAASQVSRAAARATRTYEVEVGFYQDLAPTLPVRSPDCSYAAHDPNTDGYVVLLEDAAPAVQGDQLAGCSVDEAAAALDELALLHGPRWADHRLHELPWLNRHVEGSIDDMVGLVGMMLPQFLDRYAERLSPDVVDATERLGGRLPDYLEREVGPTVVHGDFRVDNLLFGRERVFVLDWQTVRLGPAMSDVSYFLGGSISVDDRRSYEEELVRHYHERLLAAGGELGWDDCWAGYRRYAYDGLVMAVVASILVGHTERGDDMFVAMAERSGRLALDLGTG